tara:strand:+ start:26633 stop:28306 length:1674 start_codon:yes stop_codon:yes gene_type:complete
MNFTYKKNIIFILNIFILSLLVLIDPRGNIITESVLQTNSSISIAISYLVYDVKGFVGLREVYDTISQSPHINEYLSRYYAHLGGFILNFDSINEIKNYREIISNNIFEAKNLIINDPNNLHSFFGDVGYISYIIVSFILFGINLQSISLFFLTIIITSSVIFMITYQNRNIFFFILQTFLFLLIFIVISNYGGSSQIASMTNYRFISVLSIIPTLHLSFFFLDQKYLNVKNILLALTQLFILIFLYFVRGTSLWSFLFLASFYFFWIVTIGIKNLKFNKNKIYLMLSVFFIFIISVSIGNLLIQNNSSNINKHETVMLKHPFWHSAFIGIAMHPKIHEKYVCSDKEFKDIKKNPVIKCGIYPLRFPNKSSLYKNVIYFQPRDYFGYNAAVKYLNDNKINENIGMVNSFNLELSINWPRYESILKKLYFDAIYNFPVEYIYLNLVVKPLRVFFEFIKFVFYFFSAFKLNTLFILLIFISSAFLQLIIFKNIKIKEDFNFIEKQNRKSIFHIFFIFLFFTSILPSLIFYASPQSGISEALIVFFALLMFIIKKKFEKF